MENILQKLPPHDNLNYVVMREYTTKTQDNVDGWPEIELFTTFLVLSQLVPDHLDDAVTLHVLRHRAHWEFPDDWTNLKYYSPNSILGILPASDTVSKSD